MWATPGKSGRSADDFLRYGAAIVVEGQMVTKPGESEDLSAVARELIETLKSIRESGYQDEELLIHAKTLNARLTPVFRQLVGGTPLISTDYPPHVWYPRAMEWATQALAAVEGGLVKQETTSQPDIGSPSQIPAGEGAIPTDASLPPEVQESSQVTIADTPPTCFVIGPIGDRLAPVGSPGRDLYEESIRILETMIVPAAEQLGLAPVRADQLTRAGEVTEQVFRLLRDADVVIADVTGANPNVMYELGLRHTRRALTLQIGERGRLPFDINVIRTIQFVRSETGLIEAREQLREAIAAGFGGAYDEVSATRVWHESVGSMIQTPQAPEQVEDDEPGFLELLAEAETALAEVAGTITESAEVLGTVTSTISRATADIQEIDARGGGAGGRLSSVIRFAKELGSPAAELERLSGVYEGQMARTDPGVQYLLDRLEEDPRQLDEAPEFAGGIHELAEAAQQTLLAIPQMTEAVSSLEPAARALRPPARQIRSAFSRIMAATALITAWDERLQTIEARRNAGS